MPSDLLVNTDFTPVLEEGDLVIGESTAQHKRSLLTSGLGWYRHDPLAGVGAFNWLDDEVGDVGLEQKIVEQFERDGLVVKYVEILADGSINEESSYNY
jgi:hypothetical protein